MNTIYIKTNDSNIITAVTTFASDDLTPATLQVDWRAGYGSETAQTTAVRDTSIYLGLTTYIDGVFYTDETALAELIASKATAESTASELRTINEFFTAYDVQVIQYTRAVALGEIWSCTIQDTEYTDILTLHQQANLMASRKKELSNA